MSHIQLILELKRLEVVSGETLALKALVKNTGDQPFTLKVGPFSPVTYELRSPQDGQILAVFSQRDRLDSMTMGRPGPPRPVWEEELPPGASQEISDDPALYAMRGIAPGRYHLVGKLSTGDGQTESQPVEINIKPANINHLDILFCPYENVMATMFDHTDSEGSIWLFQQDTENQRMDSGVFYRRKKLEAKSPVDDLAVALKTTSDSEGRWAVWLQNNSIGAIRSWGNAFIGKADPVPVELKQPKLVKPGFQMTEDTALFLVAGLKEDAAVLQPHIVSQDNISKGKIVPLGKKVLPDRIIARYASGDQSGRFYLFWSDITGDSTRIFVREYGKDAEALTPQARQLFAKDSPLLAMEIAPLAVPPTSEGWVHALLGPVKKNEKEEFFIFVRIPIGEESGGPQEYRFTPPTTPVDAWAISGMAAGSLSEMEFKNLVVLAKSGNNILYTRAESGSEWQILKKDIPKISHLDVAASTRGYWVGVWVDPSSGVQYVNDPEFLSTR